MENVTRMESATAHKDISPETLRSANYALPFVNSK